MTVHHLGYLVKDMNKARQSFAALGFACVSEPFYDADEDAELQFLQNGSCTVELVSPRSERSSVWALLKKYKNTPYHLCYEAADFDAELADLETRGFLRVGDVRRAPALGGRRICFLYGASVGLIELLEGGEA